MPFAYQCFDRIVIHGCLSALSRPEQVVYLFRQVLGLPVVDKEVLRQRTHDYQAWVEAYAANHKIPIPWADKGVCKEDYVLPALRRLEKANAYGVYFILRSMEPGRTFRISVPKFPTQDPNHRILVHQRSRFTYCYFYTAMRFWDGSSSARQASSRSMPPLGATATPSSSGNSSALESLCTSMTGRG